MLCVPATTASIATIAATPTDGALLMLMSGLWLHTEEAHWAPATGWRHVWVLQLFNISLSTQGITPSYAGYEARPCCWSHKTPQDAGKPHSGLTHLHNIVSMRIIICEHDVTVEKVGVISAYISVPWPALLFGPGQDLVWSEPSELCAAWAAVSWRACAGANIGTTTSTSTQTPLDIMSHLRDFLWYLDIL